MNMKRISGGEITQKAITVFSPRGGDFSQADIKSQVSIIGDEFKAMKQSPWALEMFMVRVGNKGYKCSSSDQM